MPVAKKPKIRLDVIPVVEILPEFLANVCMRETVGKTPDVLRREVVPVVESHGAAAGGEFGIADADYVVGSVLGRWGGHGRSVSGWVRRGLLRAKNILLEIRGRVDLKEARGATTTMGSSSPGCPQGCGAVRLGSR